MATYGEELVHHVVRHLLHIVGGFGFVRGSRLARGLRVLASDDDALHGATHRIFDADGDGAVSARDLATVLSLARPFFSLTHVALEAKFEAALRDARERGADPGNPRGVNRERLAQTLRASPSWTRGRARSWSAPRNGSRAARAPNRTTTTTMTWDHPHLRRGSDQPRASARDARSCSAPTTPPPDP